MRTRGFERGVERRLFYNVRKVRTIVLPEQTSVYDTKAGDGRKLHAQNHLHQWRLAKVG